MDGGEGEEKYNTGPTVPPRDVPLCPPAVRKRAADRLLPAGPPWPAREKGPRCHPGG